MGRRGIALLAVLWALLLLGTLAMSLAFAMRTEAMAARNAFDATRAYYQARTGVNRAAALLASVSPEEISAMDISGEDGDVAYAVEVASESGKIDINAVPEALLKEILKKGGLADDEAESVGDAILDWRDPDDQPRPRGAEEAWYAALSEPIRPRNGRLATLTELLSVKGVTADLYRDSLSRVFTVHGRGSQVNVNAAPAAVLKALPGISPEMADAIVKRRRETPFKTPAEVIAFLGGQGVPGTTAVLFTTASSSNVYTITSRGRAGGSVRRTVRCLVAVGGPEAVKILRWEDDAPWDGETP